MNRKDLKTMKKKVVTAFMMAALGSSLVFSQAAMAADTTAKTETSEDADKDATESEDKDVAEDADKADEEKEDLKTIGEKPEEDTEGVFSVKLKNLTGKVITGVTVKNEKDEEYPDNFLKEEDKFEADEERVLWFDPNAKDKADEENKDSSDDAKETTDTEETKTAVVNINYIDSITQSCNDKLGDIVVIETDNTKIICKDPENFFTEFENLISDEEEW